MRGGLIIYVEDDDEDEDDDVIGRRKEKGEKTPSDASLEKRIFFFYL